MNEIIAWLNSDEGIQWSLDNFQQHYLWPTLKYAQDCEGDSCPAEWLRFYAHAHETQVSVQLKRIRVQDYVQPERVLWSLQLKRFQEAVRLKRFR